MDLRFAVEANVVIEDWRTGHSQTVPTQLKRAIGDRFDKAGVRDLLARGSRSTALGKADKTRIRNVIKKRSPRVPAKYTDEICAAAESQTVKLTAEAAMGRRNYKLDG